MPTLRYGASLLFDKDAPSSQLVFAELKKKGVRPHLMRYATWRTGDEDEAKDLVANALVVVCDPAQKKTWDPEARSFFGHMRRLMDDIAVVTKRTGAGKYEINETDLIRKTGNPDAFPDPADEHPLPDEALSDHRELAWLRGMGATLLKRLAGRDEPAIAVYDAACIYEEPADQAKHLGVPVAEVYEAHRRLRYHGLIVKAEWHEAEEARMIELQRKKTEKGYPS